MLIRANTVNIQMQNRQSSKDSSKAINHLQVINLLGNE